MPSGGQKLPSDFCFLRVTRDPLHPDEKTAYERRWKLTFDGPFIPFGALVSFLPSTPDDKEAVHPMGSKTIQGVFAGYHQAVGGMWSGDLYVVPIQPGQATLQTYLCRGRLC